MIVTCPACSSDFDLAVAMSRDEDAVAFAALLPELLPDLAQPLLAYLKLHKPPLRRLSIARAARLLQELLPDIRRGAVARKGRDWPVTAATWRAAIDHMLSLRDKGTLTLPLSGHGYLYEVLCGLADKAEASAERDREQQLRGRTHVAGAAPVVQHLQAVMAAAPEPDPAARLAARERLAQVRGQVLLAPLTPARRNTDAPADQPEPNP